jgi:hypothetical protein
VTATLAASTAILKTRYPDGRLPNATYDSFKYTSSVKSREDFTGADRVIALQNENPQGSSADFPIALGSLQQGKYNRFTVTRVEHFGIARIKGQALKAAEGDEGALVDLWKNECDGISRTEVMNHEIYCFGNGSGVLGILNGGVVSGTTVTLNVASDAAKFALGMRVQAVSDATLSPTLRSGGATAVITGIDRVLGVLTIAAAWNATIQAIGVSDYLVRAGDAASAGTATVLFGMGALIVGGATPGTIYGLQRNTDPVRLSGQAYVATNVPLEEAVQEMSALVAQQGAKTPRRLWCHVRDFANMKKALGTKVTYPRTSVAGKGIVGFSGYEIEGDDGVITVMTSPFIDRNTAFLVDQDSFTLDSCGPAPALQNFDKQDMLRVAGDDAFEARFYSYLNHYTNNPVSCIKATGFGA